MKRRLHVILGIILAFVALGAVPAGYLMITQPDGTGLGMNLDYLKDSPFRDFFIPGLFLFIINGLFNIAGAILCFAKNKHAAIVGLLLGILLTAWIVVQVYSTGLISFIQPLFFVIGFIEILLSFVLIQQHKLSEKIKGEGYTISRSSTGYRYPDQEKKE